MSDTIIQRNTMKVKSKLKKNQKDFIKNMEETKLSVNLPVFLENLRNCLLRQNETKGRR